MSNYVVLYCIVFQHIIVWKFSGMYFNSFLCNTPFPPAESQDAKRFPAGDVASPDYNYFISKLNFDAISSKIVTGAA